MKANVAVNAVEFRRLVRPVHTFGCAKCGTYHTEGQDPLYAAHLHRAARHHDTYASATPADVLRRLTEEN
jgi:ATP-dependent Clp protease adapter protein ClpS